jgi:hypothetical protein
MNNKYTYKIGKIYNIIKLIKLTKINNRTVAVVQCTKCGRFKKVRPYQLFDNKYNSCVCQNIKHNKCYTKIYSIYYNMRDRCLNNNCHAYKDYGGRNIKICDEWLNKDNGFINFYDWAINNGYKEGLSIDRKDNDGNYCPENCRWITRSLNTAYANKINARRKADKGTYFGISPNGVYYIFDNASKFAREHNLLAGCVRQCTNGQKNTHKKWKFGFINE